MPPRGSLLRRAGAKVQHELRINSSADDFVRQVAGDDDGEAARDSGRGSSFGQGFGERARNIAAREIMFERQQRGGSPTSAAENQFGASASRRQRCLETWRRTRVEGRCCVLTKSARPFLGDSDCYRC